MISDEKRAFKRVPRKFRVRYRVSGEKSGFRGASFSENISLGGVYFVSTEQLAIGCAIECRVDLPGKNLEGEWTARVVRCEEIHEKMITLYGIAVEFTHAKGSSEKYLKETLVR